MSQSNSPNLLGQISQQELQHLITVSTGFIDAYIVQCHAKQPMLLPQNIVLSALDNATQVQVVEWHESKLPVYAVNDPEKKMGVALVIEGDEMEQRFALMCNEMPQTIRLRISKWSMMISKPMMILPYSSTCAWAIKSFMCRICNIFKKV